MSVIRHHIEQRRCDTCVATCAAMVLGRRRGLSSPQIETLAQDIAQRYRADAMFLDVIAAELGPTQVITADPDCAGNISYLAEDLASGEWWMIALMHPGPMRTLHAGLVPSPSPRHGTLPEYGLPHAVVLAGATSDGLLCLDPWLAQAYQPISLAWGFFPAAWTGLYLPVRIIP